MKYKAAFYGGMAGRVSDDDIIEEWENPVFGFYWWYWLPAINSNGGRFRRGECVDINFHWGPFWCALTFWPN